MSTSVPPPPAVRLRVLELVVVPSGPDDAPRAHYTLRLVAADAVAPGDESSGLLAFAAPNGDPALLALGDVVTLYLGDNPPGPAEGHGEERGAGGGRRTRRG